MLFRDKITEIFYDFDEFLKNNYPTCDKDFSLTNQPEMSLSEIASIEIGYHQSKYKCFKYYYQQEILLNLKSYFPNAVSYERFVSIKHRILPYLEPFLRTTRLKLPTDANFIDSSKLEVCHMMRAPFNKVFKGVAKHGKTIMGYFYGFKFHLIINHFGQLVDVCISTANVADNNKQLLRKITENFSGLLIGDKGYITSINAELQEKKVNLVTKPRKNMKTTKHTPRVEYYKKHRGLIETTNDLLKNKANIQHTRHRSTVNFDVNIWAALIAYTYNEKLPAIKTFMQVQKTLKPLAIDMAVKFAA
jgi:hypothetical protein